MDWLLFFLMLYNVICIVTIFIPRTFRNTNQLAVGFVSIVTHLATEFAWVWLPVQILLVVIITWGGGLQSPIGQFSLFILTFSWLGLIWCLMAIFGTGDIVESVLSAGMGENYRDSIPDDRARRIRDQVKFADWRSPFNNKHSDVEIIKDIPYGPGGIRQKLDIYRPREMPDKPCPVLLQIHGGALLSG